MRPSTSVGNFTADSQREDIVRRSPNSAAWAESGEEAGEPSEPRSLEACHPVGGFRLSGPNWLLPRGDRNPPQDPTGQLQPDQEAEPGHLGGLAVLRLRVLSPEAGLRNTLLDHWADSCEGTWNMERVVVTRHVENRVVF